MPSVAGSTVLKALPRLIVPIMLVSGSNDIVSNSSDGADSSLCVAADRHQISWPCWKGAPTSPLSRGEMEPGASSRCWRGKIGDVGSRYYKLLSVAFWNAHLRDRKSFLPYLTARYGEAISEGQPMGLDIISQSHHRSARSGLRRLDSYPCDFRQLSRRLRLPAKKAFWPKLSERAC